MLQRLYKKAFQIQKRKFSRSGSDFFEKFEKLKREREIKKDNDPDLKDMFDQDPGLMDKQELKEELKELYFQDKEFQSDTTRRKKKKDQINYEKFVKNNQTLSEKVFDYINEESNNQSDIINKSKILIQSYQKQKLPKFLKNIDKQQNYLEDYNRYQYYQDNYIEQVANLPMKRIDEYKFWRRNENDYQTRAINKFYSELDPSIEKPSPFLDPKNYQAYLLKEIQRNRQEIPLGVIEPKFDKDPLTSSPKEIEKYYPGNHQFEEELNPNLFIKNMFDERYTSKEKMKKYSERTNNYLKFSQNQNKNQHSEEFYKQLKEEAERKSQDKEYDVDLEEDFEEKYFESVEIGEEEDDSNPKKLGFSLQAEIQMFLCYLEGWKIRDISLRFGASPQTIKLVVWNQQYFMEEILPQISIAEACQLLTLEENKHPVDQRVDYGADLEDLYKMESGEIVKDFPRKTLDHQIKTKETNSKTEIEEKIKLPKEDLIIEKIVTTKVKPYYIQNQIVHRGKGAMKVNRTFRDIVQRSHYEGYFTKNVNKRLHQGPRIASKGCGYKQLKIKNKLQKNVKNSLLFYIYYYKYYKMCLIQRLLLREQ